MIIVLNGYPGTGKLTIGAALAPMINARLLDIHSVYNVAFALTEFRSPEFRATVEAVEAIAHDRIRALPANQPVILTTVLAGDSPAGCAEWNRITNLAHERGGLAVIHLHCDLAENIRRIEHPGRAAKRKPRDAAYAHRNHAAAKPLLGADAPYLLHLDATHLSPDAAATEIAAWLDQSPFT